MQRAYFISAVAFALFVALVGTAHGQSDSPGFLDNLFNRGEPSPPGAVPRGAPPPQANDDELVLRVNRLENALRQLTGTIEQLQYRNQQLEAQLKRMQEEMEYRLQQGGTKGSAIPGARDSAAAGTGSAPGNASPRATSPYRRGDAFDPAEHPEAPGAPRALGSPATPLRLQPNAVPAPAEPSSPLPSSQTSDDERGTQLATLPPSDHPQDEYDLAYGYVLHKDYALAEQTFRDFLAKYPNERLAPDAQYWLGESLFQQQRYREAAESFLNVSTKYARASKAPDSLLRLGQALAALQKKDAACATFAEINRKYPRASAGVKRAAEEELKRAHC